VVDIQAIVNKISNDRGMLGSFYQGSTSGPAFQKNVGAFLVYKFDQIQVSIGASVKESITSLIIFLVYVSTRIHQEVCYC
jgi:hypothetical protein